MIDILGNIDTLRLSKNFFIFHGALYFFSDKELEERKKQALENLKRDLGINNEE